MVQEIDAALADCAEAKRLGAEIAEYRIDHVFSGETDDAEREIAEIERLVRSSALPCIVTCRPTFEGGFYDGDDAARVSLYERLGAMEHPPRYIDVEHATVSRSANIRQKVLLVVDHPGQMRGLETGLILSMHDFERRPADLTRRVLAMREDRAAAVLKVAYRARSLRDNLELFDLVRQADRPMIALGMGEFGLLSRVLAPKFGAFLTFASLRDTSTTAPGQPTITEMLARYRFRSIGRATRVYGVVGWPVGHSLSPLVHNAGFEKIGHDGVYLPLPIASEEKGGTEGGGYESFKGTMLELVDHEGLDFSGASVTIPHKEHLVRLAIEQGWGVSEDARAIGAANTLVVERDREGGFAGARVENTDAPAIEACVRSEVEEVGGKTVMVLGAGGAARAAAYAMAQAGANVIIAARTREKAEGIARDMQSVGRVSVCAWDERHAHAADVYINATPLGMHDGPGPELSPIEPKQLGRDVSGVVFFDTVYNPVRTPMLMLAEEAGARTIDGASMFVDQAARQFHAWTGVEAPITMFEGLVRARVGSR